MALDPAHRISAAHRALTSPILLETIFLFILADKLGQWEARSATNDSTADDSESQSYSHYGSAGVLRRCAQVNRFWFHEALPHLWKDVVTEASHYPLSQIFQNIQPDRRQLYANFIERASERNYHDGEKCDHILHDLTFPRLKTLHVFLNHQHRFPQVRTDVLETLILDPHYEPCYPEMYFVDQDVSAAVLDQIAVLYPNVRSIEFVDKAVADPGFLDKFRARMPNLQKFDHSLVLETNVDMFYGTVRN